MRGQGKLKTTSHFKQFRRRDLSLQVLWNDLNRLHMAHKVSFQRPKGGVLKMYVSTIHEIVTCCHI